MPISCSGVTPRIGSICGLMYVSTPSASVTKVATGSCSTSVW